MYDFTGNSNIKLSLPRIFILLIGAYLVIKIFNEVKC